MLESVCSRFMCFFFLLVVLYCCWLWIRQSFRVTKCGYRHGVPVISFKFPVTLCDWPMVSPIDFLNFFEREILIAATGCDVRHGPVQCSREKICI
jgi:hypothetical protein